LILSQFVEHCVTFSEWNLFSEKYFLDSNLPVIDKDDGALSLRLVCKQILKVVEKCRTKAGFVEKKAAHQTPGCHAHGLLVI